MADREERAASFLRARYPGRGVKQIEVADLECFARSELARRHATCNGSCDIALARRQVGPDGRVPGNARECAEMWEMESSRLSEILARLKDEHEREVVQLKSEAEMARQHASAFHDERDALAKREVGYKSMWERAMSDLDRTANERDAARREVEELRGKLREPGTFEGREVLWRHTPNFDTLTILRKNPGVSEAYVTSVTKDQTVIVLAPRDDKPASEGKTPAPPYVPTTNYPGGFVNKIRYETNRTLSHNAILELDARVRAVEGHCPPASPAL